MKTATGAAHLAGFVLAAACLALYGSQAATRYWTGAGGDGEWGTEANWSGSALGGRDATVAGVAGTGRVSGGVLTVTGEINPAGAGAVGVLTFEMTPVLSGATYVCDLVGDSADRIEFEDDVDVSGLVFRAVRNGRYNGQDVRVLVSDGEVTGPFASATFPHGKYSLEYGASAVTLTHSNGSIIIFR